MDPKTHLLSFLILLFCSSVFGQKDQIPKAAYGVQAAHDVTPESVKVGETVCVFQASSSKENHLWVPRKGFYFSTNCLVKATRLKDGWRINLMGVPLYRSDSRTDAELAGYGWIKAAEVIP